MTIDRIEVSRALAKAIAYKQSGKDALANLWAIRLVTLLGAADILAPLAQSAAISEIRERSDLALYEALTAPSGDSHGNRSD